MKKLHSGHVEVLVARLFCFRKHMIVPNVSWGWGLGHEADMIIVGEGNKVTEVEIKVTLADLKNDFKKGHNHKSKMIGRLYYAFPESMLKRGLPLIPKSCGIIIIVERNGGWKAELYRMVRYKKDYNGISTEQLVELLRLGVMRVWSLKEHNNR